SGPDDSPQGRFQIRRQCPTERAVSTQSFLLSPCTRLRTAFRSPLSRSRAAAASPRAAAPSAAERAPSLPAGGLLTARRAHAERARRGPRAGAGRGLRTQQM
uniref:Uncharacterized protein n=1 Tax=Mustela putorius furo TaxID=9669 RepID=M3XUW5_MUSPF